MGFRALCKFHVLRIFVTAFSSKPRLSVYASGSPGRTVSDLRGNHFGSAFLRHSLPEPSYSLATIAKQDVELN
jgi:hypothetical protein